MLRHRVGYLALAIALSSVPMTFVFSSDRNKNEGSHDMNGDFSISGDSESGERLGGSLVTSDSPARQAARALVSLGVESSIPRSPRRVSRKSAHNKRIGDLVRILAEGWNSQCYADAIAHPCNTTKTKASLVKISQGMQECLDQALEEGLNVNACDGLLIKWIVALRGRYNKHFQSSQVLNDQLFLTVFNADPPPRYSIVRKIYRYRNRQYLMRSNTAGLLKQWLKGQKRKYGARGQLRAVHNADFGGQSE